MMSVCVSVYVRVCVVMSLCVSVYVRVCVVRVCCVAPFVTPVAFTRGRIRSRMRRICGVMGGLFRMRTMCVCMCVCIFVCRCVLYMCMYADIYLHTREEGLLLRHRGMHVV